MNSYDHRVADNEEFAFLRDMTNRFVERDILPDQEAWEDAGELPHIIHAGSRRLIDTYARPTIDGKLSGSLGITEPSGGSDVGGLRTTVERDGDSYVINGAKTFITSGTRAGFVITAVRTGGRGSKGISLVVVPSDAEGFSVGRRLRKMGWHSSDTAELHFDDVRVPADRIVGEVDAGFSYISRLRRRKSHPGRTDLLRSEEGA